MAFGIHVDSYNIKNGRLFRCLLVPLFIVNGLYKVTENEQNVTTSTIIATS